MNTYKIIFTGPVGAGKTTAIAAISDIEPFATEEVATDEVANMKEHTTVAMDYGVMKLENGERIHLYGTPGQARFDFMWEILTEGGIGLILLLNNESPEPLKELEYYLDVFKEFIDNTSVVIGVTRSGSESANCNFTDYHRALSDRKLNIPVFEVDGRQQRDVVILTQALLHSLDPGVKN